MQWFPNNYDDAVARFRSAVAPLGGERGRWTVGPGLDVDHVYWPASDRKHTLYILVSGVHGPESYTGHAIQMMFLAELFPKLKREAAGVFMVHALNPYGFKHNRRCTEAGVNLNRNCSTDPALYKIQNPAALEMCEKFIPRRPLERVQSPWLQTKSGENGKYSFSGVPLNEFIRAVSQGQYADPRALEFGGFNAEPQVAQWMARLREILPGYRDIIFLDLHTGLGHRGRLHLLIGDKKECVNQEFFAQILRPQEDKDIYEYTPNDVEGFYPTFGSTNDLLAELCTAEQRLCALTMEFGTLGHDLPSLLESHDIWLAEHQGNHYGFASLELEREVRKRHLEKFNPAAPDWRQSVMHAAREMISRVMQRAGQIAG